MQIITDGKTEAFVTNEGKHGYRVECADWTFLCETEGQAIEKAWKLIEMISAR